MNLRVIDEHGRQLGMGRNLGALKGELGAKARGAFQALAQLKTHKLGSDRDSSMPQKSIGVGSRLSEGNRALTPIDASQGQKAANANKMGSDPDFAQRNSGSDPIPTDAQHTTWSFGELPELMEIRKSGQTLIGFPALVDGGDHVRIEVFDEPELAAAKHRKGLGRLFALQIKDALKYLEKNIPDLQKMSVAYMPLGTSEELKQQIIDVAIDRAFLQDPLPTDEAAFKKRMEEGRGRLTLIANEVARLAGVILTPRTRPRPRQTAPSNCSA
jgi:ATP-dependent helicase HrpA